MYNRHPKYDRTDGLTVDGILLVICEDYHCGMIDRQQAVEAMREHGAFEAEIDEYLED